MEHSRMTGQRVTFVGAVCEEARCNVQRHCRVEGETSETGNVVKPHGLRSHARTSWRDDHPSNLQSGAC